MKALKVKFIETSYQSKVKHAMSYGKIDGVDSANNLEAFLLEELEAGYEMQNIKPVIGNVASKLSTSINVTIGYQVFLKRITD